MTREHKIGMVMYPPIVLECQLLLSPSHICDVYSPSTITSQKATIIALTKAMVVYKALTPCTTVL